MPAQDQILAPDGTTLLGDAAHPVRVDPTGTTPQPITAASLPLPTNAATETTLNGLSNIALQQNSNLNTMKADTAIIKSNGIIAASGISKLAAKVVDFDTGSGTDNVALLGIALPSPFGAVAGGTDANPIATKIRQLATYHGVVRLAARPYTLSFAFTEAGRKQLATLFHLATSTKNLKIRRIRIALENSNVNATVWVELVRLTGGTTPADGNPAIVPTPSSSADAAAEATLLTLPTTPGVEGGLARAKAADGLGLISDLYEASSEEKPLEMKAGVAEGWAIVLDSDAATTITGHLEIDFTEQS